MSKCKTLACTSWLRLYFQCIWQRKFCLTQYILSTAIPVTNHDGPIKSSMIRQKGESQNGDNKKTEQAKFSKKWTFLKPCYAHAGVLCFLAISVLKFAFLSYHRWNVHEPLLNSQFKSYVYKSELFDFILQVFLGKSQMIYGELFLVLTNYKSFYER